MDILLQFIIPKNSKILKEIFTHQPLILNLDVNIYLSMGKWENKEILRIFESLSLYFILIIKSYFFFQ